jgi:hypothetical protein
VDGRQTVLSEATNCPARTPAAADTTPSPFAPDGHAITKTDEPTTAKNLNLLAYPTS